MARQQHIIIIGAGIIGLSTAYALLRQGQKRVTVLEQATVDHEHGASHGFSRLLRFEYGPDALYTNMVRLSLDRWRQLEWATGKTLYLRSGVLTLGRKNDHFTHASYQTARGMGLPVEQLQEDVCRRRFPHFDTSAFDIFVYNAEGGILRASACLQALRERIRDLGGEIREYSRATHLEYGDTSLPRLHLSSGETLDADRVVVAAGSWVHTLLADMRLPVRITRQYLLYFAGLDPAAFAAGRFPAFMTSNQLYGFPMHQGCNGWVKAASHDSGASISPDDRTPPDSAALARIRHQLCELLPALRPAQVARIDSCMYDLSPNGDFILDRLPIDPRVIVASGLSGHSFKFGPLLGEMLSSLVCDTDPVVPMDRFRLSNTTYALSAPAACSYAQYSH